jgi:hypothetical protein
MNVVGRATTMLFGVSLCFGFGVGEAVELPLNLLLNNINKKE